MPKTRKHTEYIIPSISEEIGTRWNYFKSEPVALPSGGIDLLNNKSYTSLVAVIKQCHRHPNGGGWVADTAYVSPSVKVEPTGFVGDNAVVVGDVIIRNYAGVFGDARVFGEATIGGGNGFEKIYNLAQVFGKADVNGGETEVFPITYTSGRAFGEVIVTNGSGIIDGAEKGDVYGSFTTAPEVSFYIDVHYPSGPQAHSKFDPITGSDSLELESGEHDLLWEPVKEALWASIHETNERDGFSPDSF